MTEKQFTALRVTLTGAAFFIGGAVLALEEWDAGVLIMALGAVLLVKDALLWAAFKWVGEITAMDDEKTEVKDDADGTD